MHEIDSNGQRIIKGPDPKKPDTIEDLSGRCVGLSRTSEGLSVLRHVAEVATLGMVSKDPNVKTASIHFLRAVGMLNNSENFSYKALGRELTVWMIGCIISSRE